MNEKYTKVKDVSLKARIVSLNGEEVLLKKTYRSLDYLYRYLEESNVNSVLFPKKKIIVSKIEYYAFPYLDCQCGPSSKRIMELKEAIMELHEKTQVQKRLKARDYKYFSRISKKLDFKFKSLELFVREHESLEKHSDMDWIIFSKYHWFLDCKKELYFLQKKIHQSIDNKEGVIYALNHGIPHLGHLVGKYLISFENARIAFICSDVAKVYVLNEHISIDWYAYINDWLGFYQKEIYKQYFKFLVLYLFMLNLNVKNDDLYMSTNNYIQIAQKIQKFMNVFKDY